MFENVYYSKKVKNEEEMNKIKHIIESLYEYFCNNFNKLPKEYIEMTSQWEKEEIVKDHIAGMTDRYAISIYTEIFVPKIWKL